jgi:hypothetical protein
MPVVSADEPGAALVITRVLEEASKPNLVPSTVTYPPGVRLTPGAIEYQVKLPETVR